MSVGGRARGFEYCTLWIVVQVEGTGQSYQVREPVVTYWVKRWEPPTIGGNPPSLPPSA